MMRRALRDLEEICIMRHQNTPFPLREGELRVIAL